MEIKQGMFACLSTKQGYSLGQCRKAMQIMELWNGCMTVACGEHGCMTKPYDHFKFIEEGHERAFKTIYTTEVFEDNRTELWKKIWIDKTEPKDHYISDIPNYGDVFTREEFVEMVSTGFLVSSDGYGRPAKDGMMSESRLDSINVVPTEATHVVWFNC
tara:strand:+ start:2064 stop:2540 length:477 start_codon:yes stop_codon:yes gene_type:complete